MSEPNRDALMIGRLAVELDTPALYIDLDRMDENIRRSASLADSAGFELRPHVKTHKMPPIARLQVTAGAVGVTAAKLGEAEVMAEAGVQDIFIAHLIVGEPKLRRLRALARSCRMAVGVDLPEHAEILSAAFRDEDRPLDVLIEVDTGSPSSSTPSPNSIFGGSSRTRVRITRRLRPRGLPRRPGRRRHSWWRRPMPSEKRRGRPAGSAWAPRRRSIAR
jgi:D-serine deaminase-like pyridoxal phosphate-dependent protein